jgi:hypothetical protein
MLPTSLVILLRGSSEHDPTPTIRIDLLSGDPSVVVLLDRERTHPPRVSRICDQKIDMRCGSVHFFLLVGFGISKNRPEPAANRR